MSNTKKSKVLIIHGWLHSSKRYAKLGEKLSKYADVDIYEFEGFGDTKYKSAKLDILNNYVENLNNYLINKKYDLVITHSMGGNILLKVLNKYKHNIKCVVLSNTAYNGLPILKPIAWIIPMTIVLFIVSKIIPKKIIKPIFSRISLSTVNELKYFDDIMFNDALKANSFVASITLFQLAFDKFTFKTSDINKDINFIITYSENDRIIPLKNTKKLICDLSNPVVIKFDKIGHTVALEAEKEYFKQISKLLESQV